MERFACSGDGRHEAGAAGAQTESGVRTGTLRVRMAEAWGGIFVMRCSMLRLRAAGVSLTGENTGTMNAGGHSCTVHRSVFFPCPEAFRRRTRFRRPPCERKLRSERHGRTTVAGPTRKLWFQDRRWPESCQGGPGKRTAFRRQGAFCLQPARAIRFCGSFSSSGESNFFRKALRRRKTRALPLRRRSAGAHRFFQNVYKAEPFTLYRPHEKVGKP